MADIGKAGAAKSPGLNEVANCSEKSSERDLTSVSDKKFLLTLPIKMSRIPKPPGARYRGDLVAISLSNWCNFLVTYGCWHIVTGLAKPDPLREQAILSEFWARYRTWKPHHQIFRVIDAEGIDVSRLAPFVLHGDEGRGYKKQGFLVCSFHSYLGQGTELANSSRKKRPYKAMRLNYVGSSWSTRFVTATLPKMFKDETAFQEILTFIKNDALDLLYNGVSDSDGNTYRIAILQCCGDWQFLVKAGSLARSFSSVEKRPRGQHACPRGICHYCAAGQLHVPFEDFSTNAAWVRTQFARDDQPFVTRPTLLDLPHEEGYAARFFTFDLWHCWHLGLGKAFLGSVLALMSERMPGGNIDLRFSNLSDKFLSWAEEAKITPYIGGLSKETIQWPDKKSYPNGHWNKGHTTTTLMKFVVWYLQREDLRDDPLLSKSLEAAVVMDEALHTLYSSDLWLDKNLAQEVGQKGLRHLALYQQMAATCFHAKTALYVLMPKSHVCNHLFLELAECQTEYILNPLAHSVQVDEDMVGRCSRVSRRVSPLQVVKRVLERCLRATFAHYVKCGYLNAL